MSRGAAQPLATGFPFSRTFVRFRSERPQTKSGQTPTEDRFYLSSQEAQARGPEEGIDLVRAHWAGVENRNPWRRDATQGEDGVRLTHPVATANLAVLRSLTLTLLSGFSEGQEAQWLPIQRERLAAEPALALDLLRQK